MNKTAKLSNLLNALEMICDETVAYFDRQTGEVHVITEEDKDYLEEETDPGDEDVEEWRRPGVEIARLIGADAGKRFVALPSKFDVHEWDIMRRFADSVEGRPGDTLQDAIHGNGAFRHFKNAIHRLGMADSWYRFRQECLEEIIRNWCETRGVELEPEEANGENRVGAKSAKSGREGENLERGRY